MVVVALYLRERKQPTNRKGLAMDDNKGLATIVFSLVAFVVCAVAAYIQRGYFAFGGEYLVLIPGFVTAGLWMAGYDG